MWHERRLLVAVAVLLALSTGGDAAGQARLSFLDERSLVVTWTELQDGVDVRVCNVSDGPVRRVRARLTGFAFRIDEVLVDQGQILAPPIAPRDVRRGRCRSIRLNSRSGAGRPDAGDYAGVLVLVDRASLVRRELTVSVPESKGSVEGVVEELGFTGKRSGWPWRRSASPDERRVLLRAPGPGQTLRIQTPTDALLGVLQNEDDRAFVYRNGKETTSGGIVYVPIRIKGANEPGDYTGALDMVGDGSADDLVKLKFKVTDSIWWAVGAILLGVLIAFLSVAYVQRWRVKGRLDDRREELPEKYGAAEANFLRAYAGKTFRDYRRPSDEAIQARQEEIRVALRDYGRDNFLFDRASEEFKKVVRTIEAVEEDATTFGDPAGFGKSLAELEVELETVARFLADDPDFTAGRRPTFVGPAAALLKGGLLQVGSATTTRLKAQELAALSKKWRSIAGVVAGYERSASDLAAREGDMAVDERRMLHEAAADLAQAKTSLFAATASSLLDEIDANTTRRGAYGRIDYLAGRYPKPEAELVETRTQILAMRPTPFDEWLAGAAFVALPGALAEAFERSIRWLADAATLVLALITAVFVGLAALYPTGTFGTWKDYIAALGLGAGATVVSKGLVDGITSLTRREKG